MQLQFLEKLHKVINENEELNTICGGDFNTYIDPTLDKDGGTLEDTSQYSSKLQSLLENYNMSDIWRINNPSTKRFTWRQNNPIIQSRLDYFFISSSIMQNVKDCDIKPSIKTDHSLLSLSLSINLNDKRGPGFWKFNSSIVKDEDLKAMNNKAIQNETL